MPGYSLIKRYQAQFENYVTHTASAHTSKRYAHCLEVFFSHFPEKDEPGDFSKMDLQEYRLTRRKKGISARTVNYEMAVVRRFWKWLMDSEVAAYNPTNGIKSLKEADVARYAFGVEEQNKVYEACLNDSERLLVGLALTTGLRERTLSELEKSDFNLEEGVMHVPPEKMKAQRPLEQPLREQEIALLKELPEGRIWGDWAKTGRALSYRWNKICKRVGIEIKGLRTARRTVATTMLRNGVDIALVKDWLSHRNIKTTSIYVTPATSSQLKNALHALPGRIDGPIAAHAE